MTCPFPQENDIGRMTANNGRVYWFPGAGNRRKRRRIRIPVLLESANGELPEDGVEDAAVAVVVDFNRSVNAADGREALLFLA